MGSEALDSPIELRVGDEHSLRLAGFGTAGYRWVAEVDGNPEVVSVERSGVEEPESDAPGAGGRETFSIRAESAGEALVKLALRRPWEPADEPAAREQTVRVRVT